MKKYTKIIMAILFFLIIVAGIIWYLNKDTLKPGYASMKSSNWPELMNGNDEISNITKGYLISTYGDGKVVNIENMEVYLPEEDNTYIQVNYGKDIYIANKIDNTVFIFKNDLMDGNIDTNIDYNNENTHIEQPTEEVLQKAKRLIQTMNKVYSEYEFTIYESNEFPTNLETASSNLYIRRDDGFAQFAISGMTESGDKSMNIVILFQNENIIGLAIQINS